MKEDSNTHETFLLRDDGTFPNHPTWPVLLYHSVLPLASDDPAGSVECVFQRNGWGNAWRNGIYSFHHYHSNTHEVLGIYSGSARVQLGGPQGIEVELRAGDVVVLPAGAAHCNLGGSRDPGVVGAYPTHERYDLLRGGAGERERAMESIRQVSKPETDPVYGREGGLLRYWSVNPGSRQVIK
jgi:uncharacterized protein YjlB